MQGFQQSEGDGNDTLSATATESGRAAGLVVYGDAGNDYIRRPNDKFVDGRIER